MSRAHDLWWSVRLFIIMSAIAPIASPCTCFPRGVKQDTSRSAVVFRGVVNNVKELPFRPESSRPRYEVTFTASQYWKGTTTKQITLHIIEPGTDCVGARFDEGKEYVVFAVSQEVDDHWLETKFRYGWLDLLPKGSKILTVSNDCDSTSEVQQAGKTLRELGKGRKPRA
jgi:hypothetical protein